MTDECDEERECPRQEHGRREVLVEDGGGHRALVLADYVAEHHDVVGRRRARDHKTREPEGIEPLGGGGGGGGGLAVGCTLEGSNGIGEVCGNTRVRVGIA